MSNQEYCGIYLDWDNIWGGLFVYMGIKIEKPPLRVPLTPEIKERVKTFINIFAEKLYLSTTDEKTRYIKAFADFDRLPYVKEFNPSLTNLLHNAGIEPFISFVTSGGKQIKDASDRSLILEVVEDIFFSKKPVDTVVIASGDVDFYPLISFVREHSDKRIKILSFKERLNKLYRELPSLRGELIEIEQLIADSESTICGEIELPLEMSTADLYDSFKKELISGVKKWNAKGRKANTGLVIKSWLPTWGLPIPPAKTNEYLQNLINEGLIEIYSTDVSKPLNGEIRLKQGSE